MATGPVGSSDVLTGKILAAVGALTRDLEPGELSLRLAGQASLAVALTVQHAATFAAVATPGKGPLPESVQRLGSMAELSAALDQRLAQVRQEAGALLDGWSAEQAETYRSVLTPERCMQDRPVLGVQEVCPDCGGRTQVTCGGCRGAGRVTCDSCGGRGSVACQSCGGSRTIHCSACSGAGRHEVREFEASYGDRQQTLNQQNQLVRRVPCSACGGRGSTACGACFDGTQRCACAGGQVTCGGCGGRGQVPCGLCAATGVVHHTGRIDCAVSRGVGVTVGGGNAEDQRTLRDRVPFDRLGAMAAETGGVRPQGRKRVEHQVTLDYAAAIPMEWAEASVRGTTVSVRAYGPEREIFDYHDLVGRLLEPDLAGLERALGTSPWLATMPGASLAGVTRRFLTAELNALIAEAAPPVSEDSAAGPGAPRRPRLGKVIGRSLLMAPVIRKFRRAGVPMRLLMIFAGLVTLTTTNLIASYLLLAFVGCFFEWRYQQSSPPESDAEAASPEGGRALEATRSPVTAGLVSADYVRRASAAVGRAVPRLYGSLVLGWGGWIAGALFVLFLVEKNFFPRWSELQKELLLLGLTGVAWLVVERHAETSLASILGAGLYGRLQDRLRKARHRYRLLPVGVFVVALAVVELLMRLTPGR